MGKFSGVTRRGKAEAEPNPRWLKMATYVRVGGISSAAKGTVVGLEGGVAYFFAYASLRFPSVVHEYILVFAQKS